jgi:hypothetical protein
MALPYHTHTEKANAGVRTDVTPAGKKNSISIQLRSQKMMTHDPFQTYATLGSYYGMPTPIGLQYPQTSAINPAATLNPLLGQSPFQGGVPQLAQTPYGLNPVQQGLINPQQLQLASLLASQLGISPVLVASVLSNPLIAASLHSQVPQFGFQQPSVYPQAGQYPPQLGQYPPQIGQYPPQIGQYPPQIGQYPSQIGQYPPQIGQMGSPFGQIPSPFSQIGYPLAPQSWIGQGVPFGQVHPFQQQLSPFQSQLNPFQSQLNPFQSQLNPFQSQLNPLLNPFQSQLSQRPFQPQGLSPWGY